VPHRTFRHTDYKEFALSRATPDGEDARQLDPSDPRDSGWNALRQYALAIGAFPGGLAPRVLSRLRADHDDRRWTVPLWPVTRTARSDPSSRPGRNTPAVRVSQPNPQPRTEELGHHVE